MKDRKIVYIIYIVAGLTLGVLGIFNVVDAFWSGMGTALLLMGIIRLLRCYRLDKNQQYRDKMQIENNDERNRFLRGKAWSWAGYLFVLISAVCVIVFKTMGQGLLSQVFAGALCLVLILYWGSYFILKKKY